LFQALYLILQLSSAAIPIINNAFLGEGRRSHATARGSVALCGDKIIIFSVFWMGVEALWLGDWQCGWWFLFSVGLASVVGGPVSTGLLQQPLASLSFAASTKS
jgi:hypothetical protein